MLSVHSDEHFMKQALVEAQKAYQEDEVPIGAVVVLNKQIIARAYNQTEKLSDVTAHAEILAYTAATQALGGKYLDQCTLYVTLEPCNMCAGALFWSKLKELKFGASDLKRGYQETSASLLHSKTIVSHGILEKECAEILQRFFQSKR